MSTTDQPAPECKQDGFVALGLSNEMLETLKKLNFHTPSDIQRELIPHALAGRDCIGQAKTGTGKTAAFAVPMIERIKPGEGLQAIVLVPTRELAAQVDEHVRMLGANHPLKTLLAYGGIKIHQQLQRIKANPEMVIGTPGRILDLIRRKALDISNIDLAVLDEVDRMLDIGFRDDIRRILRAIKNDHQTIFVSATIDDEIRRLARSYMDNPVELNVSADKLTVDEIDQSYVSVHPIDKFKTLLGLLRGEEPELTIVFTNTKAAARRVAQKLSQAGIKCKEIHGDLIQSRRESVMASFRKAHIQILVATDLASRGLDVNQISHIINYDIPVESAVYVHRIGRTARMGQRGTAITFVTPEQGPLLTAIEILTNQLIPELAADWIVRRKPEQPDKPSEAEAKAVAEEQDSKKRAAALRDPELDAAGHKPLKRTLGNRFRPRRSRR